MTSIRSKVFLIIVAVFALLVGVNFFIQRSIIYPSFLELEQKEAGEHLKRIIHAIDREIAHLNKLCGDWAVWDDSYAFMANQSKTFIASNLNEETLEADHLNLLVYCGTDGTIVWRYAVDSLNRQPFAFDFLASGRIAPHHPLLAVHPIADGQKGASGVFNSPFGSLLFATREILQSDGNGPARGYLIMGIFLDASMQQLLREQTRIGFDIVYPPAEIPSQCDIESIEALKHSSLTEMVLGGGNSLRICGIYRDDAGAPLFGLRFLLPRDITRKGIASMRYASALVVVSGLIILLILSAVLHQVILRPVQRLTEHAIRLEQGEEHRLLLDLERNDEIGRLAHSLDTMVQTISQRTKDLKEANEQLIWLSMLDGLTGIANRRMFDLNIKKEWRRAMRDQTPLSLILLDVDFFKGYNDTYGHLQGDQCLIRVASSLQQQVHRPSDLAARYGGEEFVLVLPNTSAEGAMLLAERVRSAVQALAIEHRASQVSPFVSISLGVVTTVPPVEREDGAMHEFLALADKALYQAKQQGRNRAVFEPVPSRRHLGAPDDSKPETHRSGRGEKTSHESRQ